MFKLPDPMKLSQSYIGESPFTFLSSSIVPAVDADSGSLVALVRMSVTLAGSAAGEAPVTCLAPIAALTKCSWMALALPSELVTKSSHRAFQAAITGWAH